MATSETPIAHLFVYGTLLSGSEHPMANWLRLHSRLLGPGFFAGWLYDLSTYPGAVLDPLTDAKVHGEVYCVPIPVFESLLQTLDDYEGDEYTRAVVPVQTADGPVDCWTYLFNQPTDALPLIRSGRYGK
ncbi:gamma-glutamylcyclotransferase family protein [Larkinella sp. VNQ87]|uniref:gamma-glutamylcyclotransferase family protein n=1 Tax=Larkinella sp. VNQ87 TaxID=3400921 RepID=UPI003C092844